MESIFEDFDERRKILQDQIKQTSNTKTMNKKDSLRQENDKMKLLQQYEKLVLEADVIGPQSGELNLRPKQTINRETSVNNYSKR